MKKPEISVVMSVYNGEKYLKEAVESVLSQSYKGFEFIIIDDGSTDSSLGILKQLAEKDDRISIVSRENRGLVYSLNEGVKMATGDYIARMDADDISIPERFEKQLNYIKENDFVLCGTWAMGIDEKSNIVSEMNYPPQDSKVRFYTILHNPFIHPSTMFRKDIFEKVGGYKDNFKHIEDYELWTRIVFKYKTSNLLEPLLKYRLHDDQITKKNNSEMKIKGVAVRILSFYRFISRS